jgi:EpsI family protein
VIRLLLTLLMLLGSAAAVWLHPPIDLAAGRGLLRAVPDRFGAWQGEELRFEDAVVEELRADDLLIRRYRADGRSAWLCVVYHQNRRYGAHDPHLCYESQGFVVREEGHRPVDNGTAEGMLANAFAAERRGRTRLVWYWWTTDGLTTADARRFRGRMALLGALENRSWGAFVRVETVIGDEGRAVAEARLADFAQEVARAMPAVFARARTPDPGR